MLEFADTITENSKGAILQGIASCRIPRLRSMRQFAEEEIVIPDGPKAGNRFSCWDQPWCGLWLDEVESGRWTEFGTTGARQGGKTLTCLIVPVLYHLFELRETVILGAPLDEHVSDKWKLVLKPIIEKTRYAGLIPDAGTGSRGGTSNLNAIHFGNGSALKFMTAHGDEKSRVSYTSRILLVTEVDGFDVAGENSKEGTKFAQMKGCTDSFGKRARVYIECTTSTKDGKIWKTYEDGSQSVIFSPCPECEEYVAIERNDLKGWKAARNEFEAEEKARIYCPKCHRPWTDSGRVDSMRRMVLVHRGQKPPDRSGVVHGEMPETRTLGFRWHHGHNLFQTMGNIGVKEWKAEREPNADLAEREMRQFVWTLPVSNEAEDIYQLEQKKLVTRIRPFSKGVLSAEYDLVTAAIDIGKRVLHWAAVAWQMDGTGYVIEYGTDPVLSDDMAEEVAIIIALRELRDKRLWCGWKSESGRMVRPAYVFADCGYNRKVVRQFVEESWTLNPDVFYMAKGFGTTGDDTKYLRPKEGNKQVLWYGANMHYQQDDDGAKVMHVDADEWKSWLFARLTTPLDQRSSIGFHSSEEGFHHHGIAKHLCAEKRQIEFKEGRGSKTRWKAVRQQNHWLDALYNCCAAAHAAEVRLPGEALVAGDDDGEITPREQTRPDGRSWYDVGRRNL